MEMFSPPNPIAVNPSQERNPVDYIGLPTSVFRLLYNILLPEIYENISLFLCQINLFCNSINSYLIFPKEGLS